MKKKMLAALLVAAVMGILAGCGRDDSDIAFPKPEPVTTEAPSAETDAENQNGQASEGPAVITDRVIKDGKMQSYLTGEWKDAEVVQRRGMALMISNNKPALPQYGISKAGIIFEAPMESGSCTRLMGIFEDYDDLKRIGPARSARDYFLYEAMAYDAIYCNWGLAVPYVSPVINTERVDNVSQAVRGIDNPSPEAFGRVKRNGNYAEEHTGYLLVDGYEKAVERLGYAAEYTERFEQAFTFAADGVRAEYEEYEDAVYISPGGNVSVPSGYSHANPYFEYHEEDGLYYRYQLDGAHKDEYNGEQLTCSNVIFKICHGEVRDDQGYLAFSVHGTGDAYVFTNGKVIPAAWQRDSDYEPNLFLDENGEEIVLNQGKTWVCIIWDKYADCISYK